MNRCPACGVDGALARRARARRVVHRGVRLLLPDRLWLTECVSCNEAFLDEEECVAHDKAIAEAWEADLRLRACKALDKLTETTTQEHLEQLLHLSYGYLSKLRNAAKAPSATLVGQLGLLAADPAKRLAELERFWSTPSNRPRPAPRKKRA